MWRGNEKICVLGHNSAVVRLNRAGDNIGWWDEFRYESCPWCRMDRSTCWPAVRLYDESITYKFAISITKFLVARWANIWSNHNRSFPKVAELPFRRAQQILTYSSVAKFTLIRAFSQSGFVDTRVADGAVCFEMSDCTCFDRAPNLPTCLQHTHTHTHTHIHTHTHTHTHRGRVMEREI